MNTPSATGRARVVCLEGPSAVGKTTLAARLARECGAAVVPELSAGPPPPIRESAAWFVERHAALWQRARAEAESAPFAVLDGDPFKGFWYNRVYAEEGWEGVDAVAPLYRSAVARGALAFPDLYVVLTATEAQLRQRRAGDRTRRRRSFEKHLRLLEPLRQYFTALRDAAPSRVIFVDTSGPDALVGEVLAALGRLPAGAPDSARLLGHIAAWLRANPHAAPDANAE